LVALARQGSVLCGACGRRLTREDVSEAIARVRRPPNSADAKPPRKRLWP
jgi:hypothetical protein